MATDETPQQGWVWWRGLDDFEVRIYLASFVVLFVVLLILYGVGAAVHEHAYDFACFAFACLAGIIGGIALFYSKKREGAGQSNIVKLPIDGDRPDLGRLQSPPVNRREKACYAASVLMLFFALLSYSLSHKTCESLSVMVQAWFYVLVTSVILGKRLIFDRSKGFIGVIVDMTIVITMICVIAVLIGFPWHFTEVFNIQTMKCVDQAAP